MRISDWSSDVCASDLLDSYGIIGSPPGPVFQAIVAEAARAMGTPTAAISLIDRDRQWFLASVGLDISETPRACSFCAHAMLHPNDLLCVPDASRDERFRGNPLVPASSAERRGGKAWVGKCRTRWAPY